MAAPRGPGRPPVDVDLVVPFTRLDSFIAVIDRTCAPPSGSRRSRAGEGDTHQTPKIAPDDKLAVKDSVVASVKLMAPSSLLERPQPVELHAQLLMADGSPMKTCACCGGPLAWSNLEHGLYSVAPSRPAHSSGFVCWLGAQVLQGANEPLLAAVNDFVGGAPPFGKSAHVGAVCGRRSPGLSFSPLFGLVGFRSRTSCTVR